MNKKAIAIAALLTSTNIQANELIGHVQALNKQSVVAEVSGVLKEADFEIGDIVEQNQKIAQLKATDFEFFVSKTKANLALAEADYSLRKTTFSRYQELVKKKSISNGDLDVARAEFLSAQAAVSVAKIEHDIALQDLQDTNIESSISGYIASKPVQIGAWVNEGELLYEVVNIDKVSISFMASEYDLKDFTVGQKVAIWSEAEPNEKFTAHIERIGVETNSDSRTYPVFVEINNPTYRFKPGMSVYASSDLSLIDNNAVQSSKNRESLQ